MSGSSSFDVDLSDISSGSIDLGVPAGRKQGYMKQQPKQAARKPAPDTLQRRPGQINSQGLIIGGASGPSGTGVTAQRTPFDSAPDSRGVTRRPIGSQPSLQTAMARPQTRGKPPAPVGNSASLSISLSESGSIDFSGSMDDTPAQARAQPAGLGSYGTGTSASMGMGPNSRPQGSALASANAPRSFARTTTHAEVMTFNGPTMTKTRVTKVCPAAQQTTCRGIQRNSIHTCHTSQCFSFCFQPIFTAVPMFNGTVHITWVRPDG